MKMIVLKKKVINIMKIKCNNKDNDDNDSDNEKL